MIMRSPSPRCWPHCVTLTRNTWGTDADGGRMVVSSVTVQQVGCSVQQERPTQEITVDPADGSRRVNQVIPTIVIFPENPRLFPDDLITWTVTDCDQAEVHLIRVQSQRNPSGVSSVWDVHCVERI
jgi:hypothetical protein